MNVPPMWYECENEWISRSWSLRWMVLLTVFLMLLLVAAAINVARVCCMLLLHTFRRPSVRPSVNPSVCPTFYCSSIRACCVTNMRGKERLLRWRYNLCPHLLYVHMLHTTTTTPTILAFYTSFPAFGGIATTITTTTTNINNNKNRTVSTSTQIILLIY